APFLRATLECQPVGGMAEQLNHAVECCLHTRLAAECLDPTKCLSFPEQVVIAFAGDLIGIAIEQHGKSPLEPTCDLHQHGVYCVYLCETHSDVIVAHKIHVVNRKK